MGMYATYRLCSQEKIKQARENPDSIDIDDFLDEADCDLDKMWDALHFALTGKASYEIDYENQSLKVVHHAIFGSQCLNEEECQQDDMAEPIVYVAYDQISDIVSCLESCDISDRLVQFDVAMAGEKGIYPSIWDEADEVDEIKEELKDAYQRLVSFYKKALETQHAVLVHIG